MHILYNLCSAGMDYQGTRWPKRVAYLRHFVRRLGRLKRGTLTLSTLPPRRRCLYSVVFLYLRRTAFALPTTLGLALSSLGRLFYDTLRSRFLEVLKAHNLRLS